MSNFISQFRTPKFYFTTSSKVFANTSFVQPFDIHLTSKDKMFNGCIMDFDRLYNGDKYLALKAKSQDDFELLKSVIGDYGKKDITLNLKSKSNCISSKTIKKDEWKFDSFAMGQKVLILRR